MKRIALSLGLVVLLVILGIGIPHYVATEKLRSRRIALEELRDRAEMSQEHARAIVADGRYDLYVEIRKPLIEKAVQQLLGYEQITSKGNRFVIHSLEPEFGHGMLVVRATGDFDWRFGFYHGQVAVTYHGYTKLDDRGECYIHLRVFDARPLERWSLLNRWLAPILTLRLQDRLKIPDLRLPLNYSDRFELPRYRRELADHATRITIPQRDISIHVERPLLYSTPEGLGLVIEKLGAPGQEKEVADRALDAGPSVQILDDAPPVNSGEHSDVVFSMSHAFLAQIVTRLTTPDEDVLIYIEKIPDVWQKEGEIFGKPVRYRADITHFSGFIDVYDTELKLASTGLELDFGMRGVMHGTLETSIAGILLPIPFKVLPALHDSVPVFLDAQTMELSVQEKTLEIDLDIEADIRSWALIYNHPLQFDVGSYFRPIKVPAVFQAALNIPTFVAKKEIKRVRKIPLTVDWTMEFPQNEAGNYTFYGVVEPDFEHAEEVELER